jgi:NADPH:quinone reductase-like Zn-dependent oxidoreductase
MKAIVQDGYGSADVLQLCEIDKPVVTDGHVLVLVRAASVNALDWHSVHGGKMMQAVGTLMRQPEQPVPGVDVAGHGRRSSSRCE